MHWKQRIFDRVQQLLGKEQAFCFLIAQHKLIKASQEQASGKIASRQTNVNVEIGLAIQRGFADWKLFQPRLDLSLGGAKEIGGIKAETFDIEEIEKNPARSPDPVAAEKMMESVALARAENDSVGGRVNCFIDGVPAGWGEPVFDKLDARLAAAMLSLGSVKGIEFGDGFAVAQMKGSENNDPMRAGKKFASNHAGGILGGISTGERIEFSIAVKPTPSIAREQHTVNKNGEEQTIAITGRHDPCIVPRIIPVVEAMAAIVLADFALLSRCSKI